MGQRLVIRVFESKKEQEPIAALYYHWGAYTWSALDWTRQLIEWLDREECGEDIQLECIRFAEFSGGCIDMANVGSELKYVTDKYPGVEFKTDGSRNDGLVAISPKGINYIHGWSEGDVDIFIEERLIDFEVVFIHDSIEELASWREESVDDVVSEFGPFDTVSWDKDMEFGFDEVNKYLEDLNGTESYILINDGGTVFEIIG